MPCDIGSVVVWVIDGLAPDRVSDSTMPVLAELRDGRLPGVAAHAWTRSTSVMVADTYSTHASIFTGATAEATGIPSNFVWTGDRFEGAGSTHLRAETVFERLADERPDARASIVMADPRLRALFEDQPVDFIWDPQSARRRVPIADFPVDDVTIDAVFDRLDAGDDLVSVNTQMIDLAGHVGVPGSRLHRLAMRAADCQVHRLVERLYPHGRADSQRPAIVFILSDHGMLRTVRKVVLRAWLLAHGVRGWRLRCTGGVALLAKTVSPAADEARRVRDVCRRAPGVGGAWRTGGELAAARPDWGIDVPEAGHVVAVCKPGWAFADHFDLLPGTHGVAAARDTVCLVLGPIRLVRAGRAESVAQVDIAPTLAALLGLSSPRHAVGRVLDEAFHARPSPARTDRSSR